MIFLKDNWFRSLLLILIIAFVGSAFYWFSWKPAQIRHNCSWIKMHEDAIPAKPFVPAPSKEEIKASQKAINDCEARGGIFCGMFRIVETSSQSAQPERPAKDWLREATRAEYDFCIHEKGL